MEQRVYKRSQMADIFVSAVGCLLSLPGLVILLVKAGQNGNGWHVTNCAIYGSSLVLSYAAFTLYHVFKFHERWGPFSQVLDHASIYVLISGTYTPFALVYLRGHWGWTLFAVVWTLTLIGILFKVFYVNRFKILAPLTYLFMGWLLVFAFKPAVEFIPQGGLGLLLAGGLFYSSGMIFYAWNRLPFHHAIWHLFVLAGSLCHYLAVLFYVIP